MRCVPPGRGICHGNLGRKIIDGKDGESIDSGPTANVSKERRDAAFNSAVVPGVKGKGGTARPLRKTTSLGRYVICCRLFLCHQLGMAEPTRELTQEQQALAQARNEKKLGRQQQNSLVVTPNTLDPRSWLTIPVPNTHSRQLKLLSWNVCTIFCSRNFKKTETYLLSF